MTRLILGAVLAMMPFLAQSCARPVPPYSSTCRLSVTRKTPKFERLWTGIADTLRAHDFKLDRVDRRAGVITTLPETSMHFFELWRRDVRTSHDYVEATLNPLRRWVEVAVTPADDDDAMDVSVVVHKERFSAPDRQFNSTGAAYQYFGATLPTTTGAVRIEAADERWIPIGRDPAMEAYLLHTILSHTGDVGGGGSEPDQG